MFAHGEVTRAATWLLYLPGLSVIVSQGIDTLTSNWERSIAWIEREDPNTLRVLAFHYDGHHKRDTQLEGPCQICGGTPEYAVFTFEDIIAFENGKTDCPRIQAFEAGAIARQLHKDGKLRTKSDYFQPRRNHNPRGHSARPEESGKGEDEGDSEYCYYENTKGRKV